MKAPLLNKATMVIDEKRASDLTSKEKRDFVFMCFYHMATYTTIVGINILFNKAETVLSMDMAPGYLQFPLVSGAALVAIPHALNQNALGFTIVGLCAFVGALVCVAACYADAAGNKEMTVVLMTIGATMIGFQQGSHFIQRFTALRLMPFGFRSNCISILTTCCLLGPLIMYPIVAADQYMSSLPPLAANFVVIGVYFLINIVFMRQVSFNRIENAADQSVTVMAKAKAVLTNKECLRCFVDQMSTWAMMAGHFFLFSGMAALPGFEPGMGQRIDQILFSAFVGLSWPSMKLEHVLGPKKQIVVSAVVMMVANLFLIFCHSTASHFLITAFLIGSGGSIGYMGVTMRLSQTYDDNTEFMAQGINDMSGWAATVLVSGAGAALAAKIGIDSFLVVFGVCGLALQCVVVLITLSSPEGPGVPADEEL